MDDETNDSGSSDEDILTYELVTYPLEGLFEPDNMEDQNEPANGEGVETYDEDLPAAHSYLGDNLESVSGRVILTEGTYASLPLLAASYGTLLPGQTFPLTVRDYARTYMLRQCVETDHTFGCIANKYRRIGVSEVGLYGTTAEIYEYSDEIGTVCVKAKGRQRFKVMNTRRSKGGFLVGDVKILPEVNLPKPLSTLNYSSLSRLRSTQREKCEHREAQLTRWPKWVYDQYNIDRLVNRVDKELGFLKQGLRKDKGRQPMPKDPTELSFWLATQLDAEHRLFIIKLNSPIQRIRWQLSLLGKCQQLFCCQSCKTQIGLQQDVFAMSTEGAQGTYVNPEGFLHDTITLLEAQNLKLTSPPSAEYSWFPGYAWCIAVCGTCHKHIGWSFIARKPRLKPKSFWGFTRHSVLTIPKYEKDWNEGEFKPVM